MPINVDDTVYKEIVLLTQKADENRLTSEDTAKLRKYLVDYPKIWKIAGDLSELALDRLTSPSNQLVQESVKRLLEVLKSDLGYNTAPELEQLLINEICYCWVAHSQIQNHCAALLTKGGEMSVSEFWERRLTQSQKRYLRALDALAKVRKLLAPIQINLADKQVNQIISK